MTSILLIVLMSTKRVNFNLDEELYLKFQNWAAIQGLTVTSALTDHIKAIVVDEIPENYKEQINAQVFAKLHEYVDEVLINEITKKVLERIRNTHDTHHDPSTLSTYDTHADQLTIEGAISNLTQNTQDDDLSDRQRPVRNIRTLSNAEVAVVEGLNTETVRRYLTGQRKPKDETFWERWEVCSWNSKRWIRRNNEILI